MSSIHRRLQSTPGWADFVVIVGLSGIFYMLLKVLMNISNNWKKMMKDRIEKAIQLRKSVKDNFRTANGYSWDYVLVFKIKKDNTTFTEFQKENSLKFILHKLAAAGLQTKLFYSCQCDEVYCKIRAPVTRLRMEADRINYQLPMEPAALANRLRAGNTSGPVEKQWGPVELPTDSFETTIPPYEYIYCDCDGDKPENFGLFKTWPNSTIFRGVDRLKLIAGIIAANKSKGGCGIDIYKLIKMGSVVGFFALHDIVELREVEEKWLRFCQWPWLQHVDIVKDYFGEKIGMYFVWLGHYTTWLFPASAVGFLVWIIVAADNNNPNSPIIPFFCAFIAIWATLFLEFWKRKEKMHAMKWGTEGFEDHEEERPEFIGIPDISPVDGSDILYFPNREVFLRLFQSTSVTCTLILIVIAVITGIFVMRIVLVASRNSTVSSLGSIIASIVNAVQIQVLNALYGSVAIFLNNYENHRTDTAYEDALIGKTFIFQFVNSFASLFYVAFIKPYIGDIDPCLNSNCMTELQTALGTIFLTRLATGSILAVLLPYINRRMREQAETKGVDVSDLSDVEQQYILEEYHVMLSTFADYADMVIQFAYTTMFIAAYPLATVMSLINNYVKMRVNAWKLCHLCKRPEPRSCEDIGTWYTILEIISILAVLINSALVAFTGTFTINDTWATRIWVFIIMSGCILGCKYVVAEVIPDTPLDVDIQLQRRDYIHSKIIDNIPDENDEGLTKNIWAKNEWTIRINDDDPL